MGEINAFWGNELPGRDMVCLAFPSVCQILCHDLLCPDRERFYRTFVPAQQVIEHIYGKFILIVRYNDFVPALAQVIGGCMDGGL